MKPIQKIFGLMMLTAGLLLIASCSSGTSSTSSTTRNIIGNVTNSSNDLSSSLLRVFVQEAFAQAATEDGCFADTVIATNTDGNTKSATVDENCDFTLSVTTNKSYAISFTLDDEFVASLVFESGLDGSDIETLGVTPGTTTIDLGQISVFDELAESENNPLEDVDQDDDGISDYDDDDYDEDYEFEDESEDDDGENEVEDGEDEDEEEDEDEDGEDEDEEDD